MEILVAVATPRLRDGAAATLAVGAVEIKAAARARFNIGEL